MTETTLLPPDIEATVERLLTLPEDQRLAISDRLWESVPVPVNVDPEVLDECRRRDDELVRGTEQGIRIHDAITAARQALAEARCRSPAGGT